MYKSQVYEEIKKEAFLDELRKIASGIDSAEDDISTYLGPDEYNAPQQFGGFVNSFNNPVRSMSIDRSRAIFDENAEDNNL